MAFYSQDRVPVAQKFFSQNQINLKVLKSGTAHIYENV